MKSKTVSRLKLIFLLLPILAVAFYTLSTITNSGASSVFIPAEAVKSISDMEQAPESGTPLDYTPMENVKFANFNIYNASYFQSETRGTVKADLGFTKYTQNVKNTRKVKDKTVFSEAISSSSLVSVAEQKYITKNDAVLFRPSEKIKGETVTWSNNIYPMNTDTYFSKYGLVPREITKYAITEESVISAKLISFTDNEYVYEFEINPELGGRYFKNEVRTLAGAAQDPVMKSMKATITLDDNWYVKTSVCEDVYDIAIPVLGSMTCASSLTEVFEYINADMELEESKLFEPFLPEDGDEITDVEIKDKSASDYLAQAFAPYINGEKLNLKIDALIAGKNRSIQAGIDIGSMQVDALIDGALYIGYHGDNVYIGAGGLKGYLPLSALDSVEGVTLPQLDFNAELNDDILGALFADSDLTKADGLVTINLKFNLASLFKADGKLAELTRDVDLDVDLVINEDGENVWLNRIDATVKIASLPVIVSIEPADGFNFPDLNTFKSLEDAVGFISPALNTVNGSAFDIALSAAFSYGQYNDTLTADITLNRDLTLYAKLKLQKAGIELKLNYDGKTVYADLGNLKFKFNCEDAESLFDKLKDVLSDLGLQSQLPQIDMPSLDGLNADALIDILGSLDLNELFYHIDAFETVSAKELRAAGNYNGQTYGINLKHDGKYLSALSVDKITVKDFTVKLDCALSVHEERQTLPSVSGDYVNVYQLADFISPVIDLVNASGYDFDYSLSVSSLTVYGNVKLLRTESGIDAAATLNVSGVTVYLTFKDNVIYVSAGNVKLKLGLDEIDSLIETIKPLLPKDGTESNQITDAINGAVKSLSEFLTGLTPEKILNDVLKSASLKDGVLTVTLDLNSMPVSVSLTLKDGALSSAQLSANFNGTDALVSLTLKSLNKVNNISTPVGDYSNVSDLAALLPAAVETLNKTGYDLSASVNVNGIDINFDLIINRDLSSFQLNLTAAAYDLDANVTFKNGRLYISALGLELTCDKDGLDALKAELLPLLPQDSRPAAEAAFEIIGSLLDGSFDISSLLQSGNAPELNLGEINAADLLSRLTEFKCDADSLSLTFDGITVSLTHDGQLLRSIKVSGLAINGLNLNADLTLNGASGVNYEVTVPQRDYLEVKNLVRFIAPISALIENRAFTLNIDVLLMPDGETVDRTLNLKGNLSLLIKDSGVEFQFNLSIPQDDGTNRELMIAYSGSSFYIIYDEVRVKINEGDLNGISELLSPYLPAFTPRLIEEITTMVKDNMPSFDTKSLLNLLSRVTMPTERTLRLELDVLGLVASAELSLNESGAISGLNLVTSVPDANYENQRVYVGAEITLAKMQADANGITLPALGFDYISLAQLTDYVEALLNTFTQNAYRVSFDDISVRYADKTQKVTGWIEFLPSGGIPNLKAHLDVYEGGANADFSKVSPLHSFEIMITDGQPLQEIYLTYNGVKFKLTVEELTYLLGNVKDVLGIEDGTLLDYIVPADREKVSGKFLDDFNVTALKDMSGLINNALKLITKIYDEAQLFMFDPDYDYHGLGGTINEIFDSLSSLTGTEVTPPSAYGVLKLLGQLPAVSLSDTQNADGSTLSVNVNGTAFEIDKTLGDNPYLSRWVMENLMTDNSTADFKLTMDCPDPSEIKIERPVYHDYNYATSKDGTYKRQELIDNILSGKIEGVTLPNYSAQYVEHDASFTADDIIKSQRYKWGLFTGYKQDNGGKYVRLRNGDYLDIEKDEFINAIKDLTYLEFNGEYWAYSDFFTYKNTVNDNGSTVSLDSYFERWFQNVYGMSYKDYYNLYLIGNQLNDLSNVSDLSTALLNTANLTDFHITGNLNVKIDIKIATIRVDVPIDIRVKLLPVTLADGTVVNKPLVAVTVSTPEYKAIGLIKVLSRSASQIYYWDGYLYFNKLQDGKFNYVRVSMEEFALQAADTAQLMKYVFYIAPLMDMAKDGITDAVNKGGDTTPGYFKDFFNYYYFKDSRHYAKIDLASLAGNSNLSSAEVFIGTQKLDIGSGKQSFMNGLGFTTSMVGIVTLRLDAVLTDIGQSVDYYRTPLSFSGDTPVYQDNDISGLIDYLTSRTAYGTIDSPVVG